MNPRWLNELKTALAREKDLCVVMDLFLEWVEGEWAEDPEGVPIDSDPLLEHILVASSEKLIGRKCRSIVMRLLHMPAEKFVHGVALMDRQPVVVLYFEDLHVGLAGGYRLDAPQRVELVRFKAVVTQVDENAASN